MLLLLLAQESTYAATSLLCNTVVEPICLGRLVFAGEHLADVAIVQLLLDRYNSATHLATYADATKRRVYVEGEVQDRSALGKLAYIARRCKHEYLARGLSLEALCDRLGGGVLQQLAQATKPRLGTHAALLNALIAPVSSDASLGNLVHALGAYLHLDPATLAT